MMDGSVVIGYSLGKPSIGRLVRVSVNGRPHHNFVLDRERGTVSIGDDATPAWVVALRSYSRQRRKS
jgi:hypothetical protein